MTKNKILFGQVWKAISDYRIIELYSKHQGCIMPRSTRVVVLNTPRRGANGFYVLPLISRNLDKRLSPDLKQMDLNKEGFGVLVLTNKFLKSFSLDKDQKIDFDNTNAAQFWKTIVEHTDQQLEKILAEFDDKTIEKFISDNP
jgi:hypothetical protein